MSPDPRQPRGRGDRGTELGGSTRLLTRFLTACIRVGRAVPRLVRATGRPVAALLSAIARAWGYLTGALARALAAITAWGRRHRRSVIVAAITLTALAVLGGMLVVPGAAEAGGTVGLALLVLGLGGALVFGAAVGLVFGGRWLGQMLGGPLRRFGAWLRRAARTARDVLVTLLAPLGRALLRLGRAMGAFVSGIAHAIGVMLAAFGRTVAALATRIGRGVSNIVAMVGSVLSRIGHTVGRVLSRIGHALGGLLAVIGGVVGRALSRFGHALGRVLGAIGAVLGAGFHAAIGALRALLVAVSRFLARLARPILHTVGALARVAGHALAHLLGAIARLAAPVLDAVARWINLGLAALGRVARAVGRALVGTTRRAEHAVGVAIVKARLQTRADDHAAALADARGAAHDRPAGPSSVPFRAAVDQNEFLFRDATEVHAIVTVDADVGPTTNGLTPEPETATVILLDCSGSMGRPWARLRAAQRATAASVESLRNGAWFAIVRATDEAEVLYPPDGRLVPATPETRRDAIAALRLLWPEGGTAMGAWLRLARTLVDDRPSAIARAILLTDGRDESETRAELDAALRLCTGRVQCDCRGIGTDWAVDELRTIATRTLGTVDIVADPDDLEADFLAMTDAAMAKHVGDARLRVWTPRGARVRFVKQVSPSIDDLTPLRRRIDDRTSEYPTGAWGTETRDYHVCIEVPARAVGEEMLAARVTLEVGATTASKALIRAIWTADEERATRIAPRVAHATGQAELADLIQDGLAQRRAGDATAATDRLGRAVVLATTSGNEHTLRLLEHVVDIDDAEHGTVRLRPDADLADEMALDARSSKTTRLL